MGSLGRTTHASRRRFYLFGIRGDCFRTLEILLSWNLSCKLFFENIDKIEGLDNAAKEVMLGEVYFLRAVFYNLLVKSYGGVPIITKTLTSEEGRNVTRASAEEVWAQVHADFDEAIKRLPKDAAVNGHATLGAALGMKMKSYLYTSQWDKVLEYCDKIDALGKYKLYPSYYGLFQYENEGNDETLFALCLWMVHFPKVARSTGIGSLRI